MLAGRKQLRQDRNTCGVESESHVRPRRLVHPHLGPPVGRSRNSSDPPACHDCRNFHVAAIIGRADVVPLGLQPERNFETDRPAGYGLYSGRSQTSRRPVPIQRVSDRRDHPGRCRARAPAVDRLIDLPALGRQADTSRSDRAAPAIGRQGRSVVLRCPLPLQAEASNQMNNPVCFNTACIDALRQYSPLRVAYRL